MSLNEIQSQEAIEEKDRSHNVETKKTKIAQINRNVYISSFEHQKSAKSTKFLNVKTQYNKLGR